MRIGRCNLLSKLGCSMREPPLCLRPSAGYIGIILSLMLRLRLAPTIVYRIQLCVTGPALFTAASEHINFHRYTAPPISASYDNQK
jgi:hypothetical protein